jgi:hypothetical protein
MITHSHPASYPVYYALTLLNPGRVTPNTQYFLPWKVLQGLFDAMYRKTTPSLILDRDDLTQGSAKAQSAHFGDDPFDMNSIPGFKTSHEQGKLE